MNPLLEKFCVNCLYYRYDDKDQKYGSQHRCIRPYTDLVTGVSNPYNEICALERDPVPAGSNPNSKCGPEGKYWTPRI